MRAFLSVLAIASVASCGNLSDGPEDCWEFCEWYADKITDCIEDEVRTYGSSSWISNGTMYIFTTPNVPSKPFYESCREHSFVNPDNPQSDINVCKNRWQAIEEQGCAYWD